MPPKGKGRKRAYQMPKPLPEGEVLTDVKKKQWKLGSALGSGGFGLIYRAAENTSGKVSEDAPYVVKIEPHENGPLFVELHFYQRAAQPEKVDAWQKKKKLSHLGVPKLIGCGIHQNNDIRYRFLVMQRFGDDIWKKYVACNKKFSVKTTFALASQIIDSLEYLHNHEYVHADIKSANLLLGFSKKEQNRVFLVDFGLVCRYLIDGNHKDYKEDPRKAHDGTPEFTSIDAHKGVAPSRRGDIQILGYVMLQWLCTKLPWEDKLTDCMYIMNQKIKYSKDINGLLKTCFKGATYPDELKKFLDYAFQMGYDVEPDYKFLRSLCQSALKREGFKEGGPLDFWTSASTTPSQNGGAKVASPKKRKASQERSPAKKRAKESTPGAAGAAPPAKKRATAGKAATKKQNSAKQTVKTPSPAKKQPVKRKPAVKQATSQDKASKAVKAKAGTSTPSRRVSKPRRKAAQMASSSTQTTPGLAKRAVAKR